MMTIRLYCMSTKTRSKAIPHVKTRMASKTMFTAKKKHKKSA